MGILAGLDFWMLTCAPTDLWRFVRPVTPTCLLRHRTTSDYSEDLLCICKAERIHCGAWPTLQPTLIPGTRSPHLACWTQHQRQHPAAPLPRPMTPPCQPGGGGCCRRPRTRGPPSGCCVRCPAAARGRGGTTPAGPPSWRGPGCMHADTL